MSKTMDIIASILRTAKHPFRQAEDRPTKARQHRYERRKIHEHLRVCEWQDQSLSDQGLFHGDRMPRTEH
jgi:hypothetical protein